MKHTLNFNVLTIIKIIVALVLQHNIFLQSHSLSNEPACFYKNIPVLVTGGCGFIGSHLVEKLVELGAQVSILDDLSSGNEANISVVADKVTLLRSSITDFETCLAATKNKEIIFHLAAFISVPASVDNPYNCHETNVTGNNLLEAARINNVKRFVFSSTCAIYGDSQLQCNEEMKSTPTSPYGFSKLIGETYCKEYTKVFNMETVIMRYFNVYGPRQNPHACYAGVIAKFTHNMEHDLPITIFGDGTQTRDYVPVHTVVEANIFLGMCEKNHIQGEVFNIATERSITVLELVDILRKKYTLYKGNIIFMPARAGDVKHVAADCSKYMNLYNRMTYVSTY